MAGRPAVLYVDDEHANRVVFELSFQDAFAITSVESPVAAIELLERRSFDVLLTDYRMPGMTGVELCKVAREMQPDLERVLVTAYADKQTASEAVNEGGVSAFVSKPWKPEEMQRALDAAAKTTRQSRTMKLLRETVRARARASAMAAAQAHLLHDIGNLTGLVNASAWNLRASADALGELPAGPSAALDAQLGRLQRVVDTMNGLVQRVRGLRAPGEGSDPVLGEVDLVELLELARLVTGPTAREHGVELVFEGGEGLVADGLMLDLAQVLSHVVEHAVLAAADSDPARVVVSVQPRDRRVRVLVRDTGVPFTPAEMDVAFDLLHADETMRPGVGQGLAISRRLAATGGARLVLAEHGDGVVLELELAVGMVR